MSCYIVVTERAEGNLSAYSLLGYPADRKRP
jgi:hypothetical protein